MRHSKLSLFLLALTCLVHSAAAFGCSDPEQHKIHMRQEMEASLRAKATGNQQAPAASAPSSNLDSDFFKTTPAPSAPSEGRRRR